VKGGLRKGLESWLEAGRKIGILVLLLAGSCALGFAIAWPLWLFATSQREAFTIFALLLAGSGISALAIRAALKRRTAIRDPGKPRRTALSVLLTILLTLFAFGGAYVEAALLFRGLWILGILGLLLWAGVLWALGFARRLAKGHKERPIPAENRGE
jgi:hypothetical protein